jgi:hypothetical protein
MTEADFQLTVTCVTAIAGAYAAYYGQKNHAVGQANAVKLNAVQETSNGTAHALAANLASNQSKNEDIIRSLAASTIPGTPPTAPPP